MLTQEERYPAHFIEVLALVLEYSVVTAAFIVKGFHRRSARASRIFELLRPFNPREGGCAIGGTVACPVQDQHRHSNFVDTRQHIIAVTGRIQHGRFNISA